MLNWPGSALRGSVTDIASALAMRWLTGQVKTIFEGGEPGYRASFLHS